MRWRRRAKRAPEPLADDRVAAAEREVEAARQRLRDTRENVVRPLRAYAAQNSFATIIAASLAGGRRQEGGR